MVEPLVRSLTSDVRAAAVHALGSIALVHEVQAAITSSPGFVAQALDWMDWIADATIDPASSAVASAVSVINRLFERAEGCAQNTSEGYLTHQMVERVAKRLGAGMGPMLQAWMQLPSNVQVRARGAAGAVGRASRRRAGASEAPAAATLTPPPLPPPQVAAAQLLRRLAAFIIANGAKLVDARQPAASGSISACVPPMISFLLTLSNSINPATKLEAARTVLAISRAASSTQGLDLVARWAAGRRPRVQRAGAGAAAAEGAEGAEAAPALTRPACRRHAGSPPCPSPPWARPWRRCWS
jgi:hypothetical protein